MNLHRYIIDQLAQHQDVFTHLLMIQNKNEILWKQTPDKWCLLEIVCHLIDEEKEDFRNRVKVCLESPGKTPFPINPEGWVKSKSYIKQDYEVKVSQFLEERSHSISWLKSLGDPQILQWKNGFTHVKLGFLTAEDFLRNWLAHDYLHIKQITRLKYDYLASISGETLHYAGVWK